MEARQITLLKKIVSEYIRTAQPVASASLAQQSGLVISSATVRNEMAELEQAGYIYQPHTSAGRIPTEKAYHWFVEQLPVKNKLNSKLAKRLQGVKIDSEAGIKNLAKEIAEICGSAVIVGFNREVQYYTGLSQLFAQPEFREYAQVCQISTLVDELDRRLEKIWIHLKAEPTILIGQNNPLSQECSLIVTPVNFTESNQSFIAILGPLRQDYELGAAVLSEIKNFFKLK